jgi:hypothetical protein
MDQSLVLIRPRNPPIFDATGLAPRSVLDITATI